MSLNTKSRDNNRFDTSARYRRALLIGLGDIDVEWIAELLRSGVVNRLLTPIEHVESWDAASGVSGKLHLEFVAKVLQF